MPGVFVFTRSKDDPATVFIGPYWHHIDGGNMSDINISQVTGLQAALNGKAPTAHEHEWAQIKFKPTSFPPESHTHTTEQVDGLDDALSAMVSSASVSDIWTGTQAEFDALSPDPSTLYVIKEA